MDFRTHLKHVYEWNKRDFWLLNFLCVFGALGIYAFQPYEFLQAAYIIYLFSKIFITLKSSSITPAMGAEIDQFSWKYMQSLPMDKNRLIKFHVASFILNVIPAIVWFFSFHYLILQDLFMIKDITWVTSLKILACLIPILAYCGLSSVLNLIQFPRLQYARRNRKAAFYTSSKRLSIIFFFATTIFYVDSLNLVDLSPYFQFLLKSLAHVKFLFNAWTFAFAFLILVMFRYHQVIAIWMNEKRSYVKYNWNARQDVPIVVGCLTLGLTFTNLLINTPPDHLKDSPLLVAVEQKDYQKIDRLIRAGAKVNRENQFGYNAMKVAAAQGNLNMMKFLTARRAKMGHNLIIRKDKKSFNGMDALQLAIHSNNAPAVLYLLEEHKAELNNNPLGYSPLHLAASKCNPLIIDLLIEKKAKVNAKDKFDKTPLHVASMNNCFFGVVSLIEAGANPLIKDKKGKIALDYSRQKSDSQHFFERKLRSPAGKK